MKSNMVILTIFILLVGLISESYAVECEVEMHNVRSGNILQKTFKDHSYNRRDACDEALGQCQRFLQYSGRQNAHNLTCMVKRLIVQRHCYAQVKRPNGALVGNWTGIATGPQGSGVKAIACQDALQQCADYLGSRRHSPRTVCQAENGAIMSASFGSRPQQDPVVGSPRMR